MPIARGRTGTVACYSVRAGDSKTRRRDLGSKTSGLISRGAMVNMNLFKLGRHHLHTCNIIKEHIKVKR